MRNTLAARPRKTRLGASSRQPIQVDSSTSPAGEMRAMPAAEPASASTPPPAGRRRGRPAGRGAGRRSRQRARLPRRRSVPSRRTSDGPPRPRTRARRSRWRSRTRRRPRRATRRPARRSRAAPRSPTASAPTVAATIVPRDARAERVGGEQDRDRVRAGGRGPEDEPPAARPGAPRATTRTGASHARSPDSVRAVASAGARSPRRERERQRADRGRGHSGNRRLEDRASAAHRRGARAPR